ncbi:MAG TPA: hypothetical protein VFF36_11925, partial [Planctomycetota bacterium]|nr:hypothetical protein [Planctomycetota bacterium]
MTPSPITNGGVITGSTASSRPTRRSGSRVRVTSRASASPSAVLPAAHSVASSSVFHAIPQLRAEPRQASVQIFSAVSRAPSAARLGPPGAWTAAPSTRVSGHSTNRPSSSAIA